MSVVITTENLSKRYRLGVINRRYLYRDMQTWIAKLAGRPDPNAEMDARISHDRSGAIWALNDVNIEINDGDVVGIIGRNGSGKSTLLKILSRITSPTQGSAWVKGRVASLLEVGTGFHPELTGRDNVYLNGSILGMPKNLIDKFFDEIVEFAGVSDFIDTPVKRYSSGMRVRLAFAVAAHLEPDILIVDEVLAVGDAEFQKKCLGRIGDAAKSGRTVLFVSHNAAAVENLCTKGIVLNSGKLVFSGTQMQALDFYAHSSAYAGEPISLRSDRRGSGEIRVTDIFLKDKDNRPASSIQPGAPLTILIRYAKESEAVFPNLIISLTIKTHLDVILFHVSNHVTGDNCAVNRETKGFFVCELKDLRLLPGNYRIDYRIASQSLGARLLDALDGAVEFEIASGDFYGSGHLPPFGLVMIPASWSVQNACMD
jgi:lipopolysaccharide transport system ATP-binding protein